ncbi:MAG: DNA methyltransferase [Candidatus Nitrosocaldaceae archaeon]
MQSKSEYYFVMKKEDPILARDETIRLIRTYDKEAEIFINERLVITRSSKDLKRVHDRAVMIKYAGKSFDEYDIVNLKRFSCKIISLRRLLDSEYISLIDRLANEIKSIAKDSKVDLDKPEVTFGIIVGEEIYRCILYEKRKILLDKIKKHPAELNPKLTMLMINLSNIREGETLLDPCCGTGTILLYASYHSINSIGLDISPSMCRYASLNLKHNGFVANIINSDATRIPIKRADAVVTNMPYGRASSTFGRSSKELVNAILDECKRISKSIVILCKDSDAPQGLSSYDLYVHSTLRRRLVICN